MTAEEIHEIKTGARHRRRFLDRIDREGVNEYSALRTLRINKLVPGDLWSLADIENIDAAIIMDDRVFPRLAEMCRKGEP